MEKLINKIAPYFPYNLQLYHTRLKEVFTMKEISTETDSFYYGNTVKPILRPLSDIVKEIEINGKKFIPAFELAKIIYDRNNFYKATILEYEDKLAINVYHQSGEIFWIDFHFDKLRNEYFVIEKLIEWGFDVFFMIKKGKAIDINTLDNAK